MQLTDLDTKKHMIALHSNPTNTYQMDTILDIIFVQTKKKISYLMDRILKLIFWTKFYLIS
jgi:hypothetical protein